MKKKTGLLIVYIILIVAIITAIVIIGVNEPDSESRELVREVVVSDGIPNENGFETQIIIPKKGTYVFDFAWQAKPGIITGMKCVTENKQIVSAFTAESMTMSTLPIELGAGTVSVEAFYLTNPELAAQFCETAGITDACDLDEYDYLQDGKWTTTYQISWHNTSWGNFFFKFCIVAGIVIGLLLVAIILTFTKKGDDVKCKFDERQDFVRGRAFKIAFFTMLGCNVGFGILGLLECPLFSRPEVLGCATVFISIATFAIYCIWNDAYWALNERRGSLMVVFAATGVLNLGIGIVNIFNKNIIENGSLTSGALNLFAAGMFIVIFFVMLLKYLKTGKEEQE